MWDMAALCQARYEPLKYDHGSIVTTSEVPQSKKKRSKRKKKSKEATSNGKSKKRKLSVAATKLNGGGGGERKFGSLDDCLSSRHMKSKAGWSEARVKAFSMINTNPNQYYYRFNAPGEKQRLGDWDAEEEALFIDKLRVHNTNGEWGLLAMHIPGRVGYQCSAQFRKLCDKGRITKAFADQMKPGRRGPWKKNSRLGSISRSSSAVRGSSSSAASSSSDSECSSGGKRKRDRKRKRGAAVNGDSRPTAKAKRTKRQVFVGSTTPPVSRPGSPLAIDIDALERNEKRRRRGRPKSQRPEAQSGNSTDSDSSASESEPESDADSSSDDDGSSDSDSSVATDTTPSKRRVGRPCHYNYDFPPELLPQEGETAAQRNKREERRRRYREQVYHREIRKPRVQERARRVKEEVARTKARKEEQARRSKANRDKRRAARLASPSKSMKSPRPQSFFLSPKPPHHATPQVDKHGDPRMISRHDLHWKIHGEQCGEPLVGRTRARYRRNLRLKSHFPEEDFSREANLFVFTNRVGQRTDSRNTLMPYFKEYFGVEKGYFTKGGGIPMLVEKRKKVLQQRMRRNKTSRRGSTASGERTRSLSPDCWMKYVAEGFTQVVKAPWPPPARDTSPGKYSQFWLLRRDKNTLPLPTSRPRSFSDPTEYSARPSTPKAKVFAPKAKKVAAPKAKKVAAPKPKKVAPPKAKKVAPSSSPPVKRKRGRPPLNASKRKSVSGAKMSPAAAAGKHTKKRQNVTKQKSPAPKKSVKPHSAGGSKHGGAMKSEFSPPRLPSRSKVKKGAPFTESRRKSKGSVAEPQAKRLRSSPTSKSTEKHTPAPNSSSQRRSSTRLANATPTPPRNLTPTLTGAARSPYRAVKLSSALRRSGRPRSQSVIFSPGESLSQADGHLLGISNPAARLKAEAALGDDASTESLPSAAASKKRMRASSVERDWLPEGSAAKKQKRSGTPKSSRKPSAASPSGQGTPSSAGKQRRYRSIWAMWAAGERDGLLQCARCERIYSRPDKLAHHVCRGISDTERLLLNNPDLKILECPKCGRTFDRARACKLTNHKCERADAANGKRARSCSPPRSSSSSATRGAPQRQRPPHTMMTRRRLSLTPTSTPSSSLPAAAAKRAPSRPRRPQSAQATLSTTDTQSFKHPATTTRAFRSARLQRLAKDGASPLAASPASSPRASSAAPKKAAVSSKKLTKAAPAAPKSAAVTPKKKGGTVSKRATVSPASNKQKKPPKPKGQSPRSASVSRGGDSDEGSSVDADESVFHPENYKWARCVKRKEDVDGRTWELMYATCELCTGIDWDGVADVQVHPTSFHDQRTPTKVSRIRNGKHFVRWDKLKLHEGRQSHIWAVKNSKNAPTRAKSNFTRRPSSTPTQKAPRATSAKRSSSSSTPTQKAPPATSAKRSSSSSTPTQRKPAATSAKRSTSSKPSKYVKSSAANSRRASSKPASGDASAEEEAAAAARAKSKASKAKTATAKT